MLKWLVLLTSACRAQEYEDITCWKNSECEKKIGYGSCCFVMKNEMEGISQRHCRDRAFILYYTDDK